MVASRLDYFLVENRDIMLVVVVILHIVLLRAHSEGKEKGLKQSESEMKCAFLYDG